MHVGGGSSIGGDACESNTPKTFCAPHNGFEGRGNHQAPSISLVQNDSEFAINHAILHALWRIAVNKLVFWRFF